MNKLYKMPAAFLIAGYFLVKTIDLMLHPLKGLPEPDFNNTYDSTML
jgi:hypothetical protein